MSGVLSNLQKGTGLTSVTRNYIVANKRISVNNIVAFCNSNNYFGQFNWKKHFLSIKKKPLQCFPF